MQTILAKSDGHFIVGKGKVIHGHGWLAALQQTLGGLKEDFQVAQLLEQVLVVGLVLNAEVFELLGCNEQMFRVGLVAYQQLPTGFPQR